jgi:hypothetical protein
MRRVNVLLHDSSHHAWMHNNNNNPTLGVVVNTRLWVVGGIIQEDIIAFSILDTTVSLIFVYVL